MNPTTYTVQAGDTLNGIAAAHGFSNYQEAGITGFGSNPDAITPGMVLTVGAASGPKTTQYPGVGTLTTTPKGAPVNPVAPGQTPPADLSGAYERYGITPPPASSPAPAPAPGYTPPTVAGLPSYPATTPTTPTPQSAIMDAYNTTLSTINDLESKLTNASTPSTEEVALTKQLADAKAKLNSFDLSTLQAEEGLRGQGRGATIGTIDTRQTVLDRTRALERLGFAQDANTIAEQLTAAQNNRQALGDVAKTEYDLATKKLDIALGIQDKIDTLTQKDQTDARQYLLDVVNFAQGKTYDQLSPDTQQAITHAVANSPITLDMVQTALQNGASTNDLRSVPGVGVVNIKPDGTYKVVVPENPSHSTSPGNPGNSVPSFNDYLASQNIPIPSLTTDKLNQLHAEYNAKYGSASTVGGTTTQQLAEADQLLTFGLKSNDGSQTLYNGRGSDGYVDPGLYTAIFNTLDTAGKAAFLKKYPPAKNLNPQNIGSASLPTPIANALIAGQPKKKASTAAPIQ